ncbi:MAG: magnesium-protoporphyrin IX monomethyl ester (oxidative) cyclase, partial [Cyanobacteria bacterium J06555_13]
TYLSEKIGYWRYITIFRHLEQNPEDTIYPIFNFFDNWCQDENRHGDFFAAMMKSQPQFLNDLKARLWCRFFLLSVFATMYLNDIQRKSFYAALGLDAREYDIEVIKKTNESAGRLFPITLDVEDPKFFAELDECTKHTAAISKISQSGQNKVLQTLRKIPHITAIGSKMISLYLMKPISMAGNREIVK